VEKRKRAKSILDENQATIKDTISTIEFKEDYPGEEDQFGTERWVYVLASTRCFCSLAFFLRHKPCVSKKLLSVY